MAKCNTCGSMVLIGGKTEGALRFCNEKCQVKGEIVRLAQQIPADVLDAEVASVHGGACPKCSGPGPVDIRVSHSIWSALYLSSWKSKPELCCRKCGLKAQLRGALFSLVLGWWGIPWGVLGTPVQIGRNIWAMIFAPNPTKPSAPLREMVKMGLAAQLLEAQNGTALQGTAPIPPIAEPFATQPVLAAPPGMPSAPVSPFSNQDAFKS